MPIKCCLKTNWQKTRVHHLPQYSHNLWRHCQLYRNKKNWRSYAYGQIKDVQLKNV